MTHFPFSRMQEIAERELSVMEQQKNEIQVDMDQLKTRGDRLNELHAKRDQILGKRVGGVVEVA